MATGKPAGRSGLIMSAVSIVIYTTPFCGYCAAAKSLLKKKGVSYEEIDVSGNQELRAELLENTGQRTVPQIYINEEHIGGFDDMNALDQAGELDPRLGL